jgi:cytochrome c6
MNSRTSKLMLAAVTILAIALAAAFQLVAAPQAKEGADVFKSKCAMCHGPDGAGATAMGKKQGVRDLRSADVQKQTDAQLTEIITKGKGKMPSYAEKVTADQVKQLVAFIRELKK